MDFAFSWDFGRALMWIVLLPLLGMTAATPWAEPLWQAIKPGAAETIANATKREPVRMPDLNPTL